MKNATHCCNFEKNGTVHWLGWMMLTSLSVWIQWASIKTSSVTISGFELGVDVPIFMTLCFTSLGFLAGYKRWGLLSSPILPAELKPLVSVKITRCLGPVWVMLSMAVVLKYYEFTKIWMRNPISFPFEMKWLEISFCITSGCFLLSMICWAIQEMRLVKTGRFTYWNKILRLSRDLRQVSFLLRILPIWIHLQKRPHFGRVFFVSYGCLHFPG